MYSVCRFSIFESIHVVLEFHDICSFNMAFQKHIEATKKAVKPFER